MLINLSKLYFLIPVISFIVNFFFTFSGSTKVTLRGYEWLTYQLYDNPQYRTSSENNRFSLQFKVTNTLF